jgi:hypothetical protein
MLRERLLGLFYRDYEEYISERINRITQFCYDITLVNSDKKLLTLMSTETEKVFEFEQALVFYHNPECKFFISYDCLCRKLTVHHCGKATLR